MIRAGLTTSVHDCSRGGIAVALAKMCIPTCMGAEVDLQKASRDSMSSAGLLFSETHGRYVVTVKHSRIRVAEGMLAEGQIPHAMIGTVKGHNLRISLGGKSLVAVSVSEMAKVWESSLPRIMGETP
jgi:phosphoribosylformylglycinamidine synthase